MNTRHEVLIGPYRSGKSWQLLEKALGHCRANPELSREALIIVPSSRYRDLTEKRLYELLLKEKQKKASSTAAGLWGLQILTFNQFCQKTLLKADVFVKSLPEATRPILISNIGKQLIKEGQIEKLAPVLGFGGTQRAILDLIDEWQKCGHNSAQVMRQIKDKEKNGYHLELAQIYSRYEEFLKQNNYQDKYGMLFRLVELLNNQNGLMQSAPTDFIVVDGFDRWDILHLRLLKALTRHVPELHISFDYEKPGDNLLEEYAWKETNYEQIRELLGREFRFVKMDAETEHIRMDENIRDTGALAHAPTVPSNNVEVFCAGDRLAETAIIAARVKAAIVLDGIKPVDIVVTARNIDLYKSAIEAAFQDAGLDYFLDQSIKLITLPVVRFLLSLLSIADKDFKRREVIDCLRSPFFHLSAFNLTAKHIEQLNALSLDEKIWVVGGRDQWLAATKNEPELASTLKNIFNAFTPPSNINSALQYVTWAEDLFAKVVDFTASADHHAAINQFRRTLAHLIEEEQILDLINSVGARFIRPLEATTNTEIVGARASAPATSYHQRLLELIKNANFAPSSPDAGKVLICSAEIVPNKKYKQIYIAGMLEGEFPKVQSRSGFLTGEELSNWKRFGIPLHNPRLEPGFDYALFTSLIKRAEAKITLSYPAAEITSGKEEPVPSFLLSSLELIKDNDEIQLLTFETFTRTANSLRNAMAYCLWHKLPIAELANKHPLLLDFGQHLDERLSFAERRSQQKSNSPLNGYLCDHVLAGTAKVTLPEYWSVGQLNDYGKCPFNYWLTRGLKIKSHAEPESGLSPLEKGNFYHKALELFYEQVIARGLSMIAEDDMELKQAFKQAVDEAIKWIESLKNFRPGEFWEQEKADLRFHLDNFFNREREHFLKEGGQFIPYKVEAAFGQGLSSQASQDMAASAPLIVNHAGRSIKFRGKIDRIDIETGTSNREHKRLRLVDYKSGSLPNENDLLSGRDNQLPLYSLAVEQSVLPGSEVVDCSYASIQAGNIKKVYSDDLRANLSLLPAKIVEFIERIEAGNFSVAPSSKDVCRSCDHQTVCRVKEFPQPLTLDDRDMEEDESSEN